MPTTMIDNLAIAEGFGIGSLKQFRVLLQQADGNLSIEEGVKLEPRNIKYKEHYVCCAKAYERIT